MGDNNNFITNFNGTTTVSTMRPCVKLLLRELKEKVFIISINKDMTLRYLNNSFTTVSPRYIINVLCNNTQEL